MPKKQITVAVLRGGDSAEREISLLSGEAVASACRNLGYKVIELDPSTDLVKLIQLKDSIDVVFPALHGRGGEDGKIQGLLELLKLPYVGGDVFSCAQAFDKPKAKTAYCVVKLPVAKDCVVKRNSKTAEAEVIKAVGIPCFVKPVNEGSSYGSSPVKELKDLLPALRAAWKYGDALVEELLMGTEITVGVIGEGEDSIALPIVEIVPKTAFFDFKAKYDPAFVSEIVPARISPKLTKEAQKLAIAAHRALSLRDISRTDMIIQREKIYLLETNTLPGLTRNSLIPKMAKGLGMSFDQLVEKLIKFALKR
ncbi:MAG: D-alanine--D-alanine ligase [Candidatus Gracilibacteria bacterium]|nr:D-alanine--D-alanine ligase [Candidatus Gracilibacteria bacterium]MDD5179400.1 D-alanine--D-alanine ligase [Candidatus Gracilibacteria bacterium]